MSAARLREAARVLRERAEAVIARDHNPGRAIDNFVDYYAQRRISTDSLGVDAAYISLMHPSVGLALADWLDTAGADLWAHGPLCECGSGCLACDDDLWQPHVRRALAVASLVLGIEVSDR